MTNHLRRADVAIAYLLLLSLFGCYSNSILQEPRVLKPGTARGAVGIQAYPRQLEVAPELGIRVGIAERTEARFKFTPVGMDLGVNVLVVDQSLFRMLAMPMVKAYQNVDTDTDEDRFNEEDREPAHAFHAASLPVLMAVQLHPVWGGIDLFMGPEVQGGLRDKERFAALVGHLGLAIPLRRHAHIIPELSLSWTFHGPAAVNEFGGDLLARDAYYAQGDVALQFGIGWTLGSPYAQAR